MRPDALRRPRDDHEHDRLRRPDADPATRTSSRCCRPIPTAWPAAPPRRSLRYEGAIKILHRWTLEDHEIRGREIKAGDRVYIAPAAANRDPEKFEDPDRVRHHARPEPAHRVRQGHPRLHRGPARAARDEALAGQHGQAAPGPAAGRRRAELNWAPSLASRGLAGAADRPRREAGGVMAKVDVAIIGAGAAGLTAAALLAKEGKKVTVIEASKLARRPRHGRARRGLQAQPRRPPARGLRLRHHQGPRVRRQEARARQRAPATCRSGTTRSERWGSIRDRYSGDKSELKKVIKALMETPYEALDEWDDRRCASGCASTRTTRA